MRKSGFFPRLALVNLMRNGRFYGPYLLSCGMTAAMYYILSYLTFSDIVASVRGAGYLQSLMYLGRLVVTLFSAVLLLYANSFVMKRRRRELGLYNILGLEKRHTARLMVWETLYCAAAAIVGGLAAGVLLSKLVLLLLLQLSHLPVEYGFEISLSGMADTAALFGFLFLLTLVWNLFGLLRSRPVELLHSASAGEREPRTRRLLVVLGAVTLGAGYATALTVEDPFTALAYFFLAVALVMVGTYCLFTAGSIALLKHLRNSPRYYYQPKHFTAVAGLLYRMKQNAVGLANICILSTMVLVTVSTCVCLYLGTGDALNTMYPHDITYSQSWQDSGNRSKEEVKAQIQEVLDKAGMVPTHVQEMDQLTSVNSMLEGSTLGLVDPEANLSDLSNTVTTLITTAESYRQMTGTALDLAPGEVALNASEDHEDWQTVTFLDLTFSVKEWLPEPPDLFVEGYSDQYLFLVVAGEDDLEAIYQQQLQAKDGEIGLVSKIYWGYSMDFDGATKDQITRLYDLLLGNVLTDAGDGSFSCRDVQESEFYALYGGLLFLGLFLGLLFLMATVLIIYYKQISEGYEDKERFAILEKVGMSQQQVRTAIRSQVRMVFFLPLLGAIIHLAASFKMISKLMAALGLQNIPLFALCCAGTVAAFAVGYFIIYHLTARTYYKIVR